MDRSSHLSLWDATAEEPAVTSAELPNDVIDVAIVGGGYTGLSTALHCAEKGLSAHVLEEREVGYGGSGRNAGLVNAGTWLPPDDVERALGPKFGPRFLRRFSDGPAFVFHLVEKHQIRCEVTRTGTIHAAHGPAGMKNLRARHAGWQKLGEPVDLVGAEEVAELTGTRRFHGGLLDHRAGTINPMGYCRGLARAAMGAGAGISTGVHVQGLDQKDDIWNVKTSAGHVRARAVVLGTNAYTDTLWPGLNSVYSTIHYLQFATRPLGPEAAHILPGRQGVWDTGQIMFSIRRDAFDRLVVGTMGRVIGTKDSGLTRNWAARQVAKTFPELGKVSFDESWHGKIAMTSDHLPRIHRLAPGLWTAIGYNGRGITTGTLFGSAMADLLTGMDPLELPLPVSEPTKASRAGFTSRFYDLAFTANQFWKSIR